MRKILSLIMLLITGLAFQNCSAPEKSAIGSADLSSDISPLKAEVVLANAKSCVPIINSVGLKNLSTDFAMQQVASHVEQLENEALKRATTCTS